MFFECRAHLQQFRVALRHHLLQLDNGLRCADTRDHVLALCVNQKFAVELVHAIRRIAGEGNAGARILAGIAVDHRLHVDRRAPVLRDVVFPAIDNRPVVHP